MSLSSFLSKLHYGSYRKSSKALAYEEIADEFRVSPQHVYEIAHGKRIHIMEDRKIFNELVVRGFIVCKFI